MDEILLYLTFHTKGQCDVNQLNVRKMNFREPKSYSSFTIDVGRDPELFNFLCSKHSTLSIFSFYYQNVSGVKIKITELFTKSLWVNFSCVCLTETWLDSSVLDSEIFILKPLSILE